MNKPMAYLDADDYHHITVLKDQSIGLFCVKRASRTYIPVWGTPAGNPEKRARFVKALADFEEASKRLGAKPNSKKVHLTFARASMRVLALYDRR